jgi:glycosyltransferase involved in cell wall biosynthesis
MSLSISVIIPTYNRAALVQRAITSLIKQTRLPDEIIIIDDGSTDETPDILAQYSAPVRTIRQPNAGRSAARNTGLQIATGDLIALLDSDDFLPPESIARRAAVFERDPALGVVYTDVHLVDPHGHALRTLSAIYPVPHPSGMIFAELMRRDMIVLSSVMMRRAILGDLVFDASLDLAEDYDLWLKLAATHRFHYIDEPLACYSVPEDIEFTVARWGIPGKSGAAAPRRARLHEIDVQRREMALPAFPALTDIQRSRIYCSHGMKTMMIGQSEAGRRMFWRAIRSTPYYPVGWVLLGLSLFGRRMFEFAVWTRRGAIRFLRSG